MVDIDRSIIIQNNKYKEECHLLDQINDIIQRDPSWSDELKQKVDQAFRTAISTMIYVGKLAEEQDDLK